MNNAILQYFNRAGWALHNATNDALPPIVKSHLTATAVHACQSLKESLERAADDAGDGDRQLAAAVRELPHAELIANVRNMDLHGWPLPICDPKVRMMAMVSKPGNPMEISSSGGAGISVQMEGLKPRVRRTPNDLKHAGFKPGGATVSYGCNEGKLIVYDFSTDKAYSLLEVLKSFLQRCEVLIKARVPEATESPEPERASAEDDATGP